MTPKITKRGDRQMTGEIAKPEPWFLKYTMDIEGPFSYINPKSSHTDKPRGPTRSGWQRDVLQECGLLMDQGLMPSLK